MKMPLFLRRHPVCNAILLALSTFFLAATAHADVVSTPTFSPDGGAFVTQTNVTISCATEGATIHYTTTGGDPSENDPTVASGSSVLVDRTQRLKAMAFKDNWDPSIIKMATYCITVPIAAGFGHALAVKTDVTGWAWGAAGANGTSFNRFGPMSVTNLSTVMALSGGLYHSVALKADGGIWTWGDNSAGQLGEPSSAGSRLSPAQVSGISNVVAVAAGGFHTLAVKADGSVWGGVRDTTGQDNWAPAIIPDPVPASFKPSDRRI